MRFVATAFGSAGDFLPTLAVADALRAEGHEVVFVTNPFHERVIRARGIEFVPAGAEVDLYGLIVQNPDWLTTGGGLRAIVEDLAAPYFAATYFVVRDLLVRQRFDGVVGGDLSPGLFWAAIERRLPSYMISATPIMWVTGHAPAQLLDFRVPEWLLPYAAGAFHAIWVELVDHFLRSVARTAGATSFDASLSAIQRGLALHAGMWPELMRPPSPMDLPNKRACGFARAGHLGTTAPALSPELEAFLASGAPPVVIALGSIFSLGSGDVIADAALACADLDKRCVLVGRPPQDRELPPGTLVVPYATYHLLFPRAEAVVIHGGAGTTGEALRSGCPSVVVPLGFDQFGIAWRMEHLGAGVRVAKRGRSREALREAIRTACETEAIRARAEEIGAELARAPDGALATARLIAETTLARGGA